MDDDGDDGGDRRYAIYCLDCGWSVSTAEVDSIETLSRRALEHFVETGHTVESTDRLPPPLSDSG